MNKTYRLAQFLSYTYLRCFHRFEVNGTENVPQKGGFILACNHLSYIDPPAVGCKIPRNLHYFARDSLFFWPLGLLISNLNSITVNRKQLDLGTLRRVLLVLKNGKPVLLFPEGTRSPDGTLQKSQKGLGLLVHKSGVPVLPARLHGFWNSRKRENGSKNRKKTIFKYWRIASIEQVFVCFRRWEPLPKNFRYGDA